MGCDIHPVCQWKSEGSNWWLNGGEPDSDRNYAFFAQLADQRNNHDLIVPPLAARRGWPEYWENDDDERPVLIDGDYGESWASLPEMQAYFEKPLYEHAIWQWKRWVEYGEFIAKYHEVPFDCVRFVWNFDN